MSKTLSIESIKQRIKEIASREKKSFNQVLHELLLERAVARLVEDSRLSRNLVFKGGYVSLRCYGSSRLTIDLDAAIYNMPIEEAIERAKAAMDASFDDVIWYSFETQIDLATQNEYGGIRLQYRAGLGFPPNNLKKAIVVKIDLGFGDPITPAASVDSLKSMLGDQTLTWSTYPVETIVAEKIHSMIHHGAINSRSKDVYDLYFYINQIDELTLKEALKRTFAYRQTDLPKSLSETLTQTETVILKKGWKAAVRNIVPQPDFDKCFQHICQSLLEMKM